LTKYVKVTHIKLYFIIFSRFCCCS